MKLLIKLFIILSICFVSHWVYASNWSTEKSFTWVTVQSTIDIPWMKCTKAKTVSWQSEAETKIYNCDVEKWFSSMIKLMSWMIKYFTYIALISAVLYIVINGIMYSMSWVDSTMKDEAKKRIIKTLTWIVLLLIWGFLLSLFFPWIYK